MGRPYRWMMSSVQKTSPQDKTPMKALCLVLSISKTRLLPVFQHALDVSSELVACRAVNLAMVKGQR